MMNKYLSNKLTILYTVLIIMVVYIHSYYLEAEQYWTASFLQKLTGGGICRIANCLFFAISGYLFARNIHSNSDVFHKMRKRLRTLLIPYLIWNVIFILWYVLLDVIPGVDRWVNGGGVLNQIINQSIWQTLCQLWWNPAAFQLWFLRDLLVMVLFTPLLCWWARKHWQSALIAALVSTVFYGWLVYFWIGIILSTQKADVENYPRSRWALFVTSLLFLGYAVYVALCRALPTYIEVFVNLAGLYVVWCIYDILAKGRDDISRHGLWKWICGYSFFIYLFHEPAFNIIKKLTLAIAGASEPTLILLYYINPWIMVAFAVVVAKLLQRIMPPVYKVLTGGR